MNRSPLLLDTGGWLRALAGDNEYAQALTAARPAIVPGLVLAEVDWHLRAQRSAMHRILDEMVAGAYVHEPATTRDLARAREIDAKFKDLALGLVDASVAALAERLHIHRVLTTDKDFASIRIGRYWRVAIDLAVALQGIQRG